VHIGSLVAKELVGPERSLLPGDDAYRFRHLLIRDAAYDAIPKADRAALHEAFAGWLERVASDRIAEQEEILAYHLERAASLRAELDPADERLPSLRARAAERLTSAAYRARQRADDPATATSSVARSRCCLGRAPNAGSACPIWRSRSTMRDASTV
jgi:predicted ATPase